MTSFIEWLESRSEKETRIRAELRRSLAFEPGSYVPAFPYVEPFLKSEDSAWRRKVHYLLAGLWAAHFIPDRHDKPLSIGQACARHQQATGSASTERRFINLLDADPDQLPHRLRQMVALLKEYSLDYEGMLRGLLYWNDAQKRTQSAWARDFYRSHDTTDIDDDESKEN